MLTNAPSQRKAVHRIAVEGDEDDADLAEGSRFYGKKAQFAMHNYLYIFIYI